MSEKISGIGPGTLALMERGRSGEFSLSDFQNDQQLQVLIANEFITDLGAGRFITNQKGRNYLDDVASNNA
jgi:hypothetical protein